VLTENKHTLVDFLRDRACGKADATAYTFLTDGERAEATLTYAQFDARARAVAAVLSGLAPAGSRALILYPPGLDYLVAFFGCLYAAMVAVPAYPPRQARGAGRLRAIFGDARPAVALASPAIRAELSERADGEPALPGIAWCAVEEVSEAEAERWTPPPLHAGSLAFLQYTSGSTGSPKGVMLTHANLIDNQEMIRAGFAHDEQTIFVGWLPLYHDMGLIGNVFQPLFLGIPCVLFSPLHFLERPVRWLQAITRYRGTTSGGPNFAYELCVRKVTPEDRASLDLSTWTVAFNGAEPVRADTLARFTRAFASCGFGATSFYPCYGLAEASLIVSGGARDAAPVVRGFDKAALERRRVRPEDGGGARQLVGCGRSLCKGQIAIVDPALRQPCQEDEIGEIWVAGPSVASGYYHNEDETDRVFSATLPGQEDTPFLRTGDLGFFHDGELFVAGRMKDLVIIRGRNHYPQDIERTAESSHPMLAPGGGAAFSMEAGGEERLVVLHEVHRHCRGEDLARAIEAIRRAVAEEHEVQVHCVGLLKPGSLLKTSSGKVQRAACRSAFLDGSLPTVARDALGDELADDGAPPLDRRALADMSPEARGAAVVAWLATATARALRVREVDSSRALSTYGLDSLIAVQLVAALEESLGVSVPATAALHDATIESLAARVEGALVAETPETPPALETGPSDGFLSDGQRALLFLQQLEPGSSAYNLARAYVLREAVDEAALERARASLLARHPSLRVIFPTESAAAPLGEPLPPLVVDASAWTDDETRARIAEEANRPYDVARGPLFRMHLFRRGGGAPSILLIGAHHIVADLWSLAIVLKELGALYDAERKGLTAVLAPTLDFARFAGEEARLLASPEGERMFERRRASLRGDLVPSGLPTERAHEAVGERGAILRTHLDASVTARLEVLARRHGATLFNATLAVFHALLARWTGRSETRVGVPMANRRRPESKWVVGPFMNPVVVDADLTDNPTFLELLGRVRSATGSALECEAYPFARLVSRLQPPRERGRSPLFDVLFAFQSTHPAVEPEIASLATDDAAEGRLGESLSLRGIAIDGAAAPFDLSVNLVRAGEELRVIWHYRADLFDAAVIERMAADFVGIASAAGENGGTRIANLGRAALPVESPGRQVIPCVHEIIAAHVARTPNATAVIFEGGTLTYSELDSRAGRLAARLAAAGVTSEDRVAVLVERGPDLVVALLGVMKAGAAYVPLDPAHPCERLSYVMADAGVEALVARADFAGAPSSARLVPVDGPDAPVQTVAPSILGANLAYVIYTSGSTGRPKGVEITHTSLANVLLSFARTLGFGPGDRVAAITTISFDIAALEIFLPLVAGAALEIVSREVTMDGRALAHRLRGASLFQATPATFRMLVESGWTGEPGLTLLCGGEALPPDLARALVERCEALYNVYGPTETTIWSSLHRVESVAPDATTIPIGEPVEATSLLVLDHQLQPTPPGVAGELCIGGEGLARGYHARPDLTAERFVPHPAVPGGRLYRTGDRVRRRGDGTLEYLGRSDDQVKIRGVRIEPAEIEAVLCRHPSVRAALVLARKDAAGEVRLVAYVQAPEQEAPVATLGSMLRAELPDAYIPRAYVFVEAWPLTPAGKIDRAALRSHGSARTTRATYAAPREPNERVIAAIWREVLGVDQVGIDDDFFELGGHSLLVARTRAKLEAAFDRRLLMRDLFQYPTVRALAASLTQEPRSGLGPHSSSKRDPGRDTSFAATEDALRAGRERLRGRRRAPDGGGE
jgi:amino acid adenylation domain-containing protein